MTDYDYDVVVVGSGFGGSVAALRLTEKGYRVLVVEAGRRFTRESLPRTSWALKDYVWAPRLGLYGIQRIHVLGNVMVLAGAGVGGGSLNYANTLYVPPSAFFKDPQWGAITDWEDELRPYYGQAQRMLGVRQNPTTTEADEYLRATAESMGVGSSFHLTPVGVFFGDGQDGNGCKAAPGEEAPDPYFGGAGPSRHACTECGECMTGCRHGAKNTLNENYLYLAERAGAEIRPMTTVVDVRANAAGGTTAADAVYEVSLVPTQSRRKAKPTVLRTRHIVLAAGTYGTQTLLHRIREGGGLPQISAQLGALTFPRPYRKRRGAQGQPDFTRGVAITSSIHPNQTTHIENVRYGKGSNTMALMCVPQYRVGGRLPKPLAAALAFLTHPVMVARTLSTRHWSERTIIGLVMQTHDNSL
ncbi:MAG TPA: GMC family oxidoreductase N-terminal domain-containing protein, partial [Actinospica sp.]|nr:GMC family oxidoreductase N-terminal domain-containing protein [Actinospica sp.]